MGVGRYTPTAAVHGDIGWTPVIVKQWQSVLSHWNRLRNLDNDRLNRKVLVWADSFGGPNKRNWNFKIKDKFKECDILESYVLNNDTSNFSFIKNTICDKIFNAYMSKWHTDLNRTTALRGNGLNKLRVYRQFKHSFNTEQYMLINMPISARSAYAKFRCGVAPIRVETGRYEHLPLESRTCVCCPTEVENEEHVLLVCPLYDDIRDNLFRKLNYFNFQNSSNHDKLSVILGAIDNIDLCAKTCKDILDRRRRFLYQ